MLSGAKKFLTPSEVVERYEGKISTRTLANWRCSGVGPPYVKVGGRILYKIELVVEWENNRTVNGTFQYKK